MQTTIENDNGVDILVMRIPLAKSPTVSSTGKSKIIASTNGFCKPEITFLGKQVSISLNVIIPNK